MKYFKNIKKDQHLFLECKPTWYEKFLFKLKNNKIEFDYGYSEKDNEKEISKRLDTLIAKHGKKGFVESEIPETAIDLANGFCKAIEIGKVYYFHLEDENPLMEQKIAAVKITRNPSKQEMYQVCRFPTDEDGTSFSTISDYLIMGQIPLECEEVTDFEVEKDLKYTLWMLSTLGFERLEEKELLEKIAGKSLDFEQEYEADIYAKKHHFGKSEAYAKVNFFENDLLVITKEYFVENEKIIATEKSYSIFQTIEEFKAGEKNIKIAYQEYLKWLMPETEFLNKYPMEIEAIPFFQAPETAKITAPKLPIKIPQGEIDFPIKAFYLNLVDVNRLYFYVNEEGENPLEWKAAFIIVKNLNRVIYLATKVFTLKNFNKIYQNTEESEELKYSSDLEDFFKKKASSYKKAKLKPYDTEKVIEILSGKSLADLNQQKPVDTFSFQGNYFKHLVECYGNYANVWIAGNDKIHYLQFFSDDASRKEWLENLKPKESVAFYPTEIKRIDDFIQHIKTQENAFALKFSLSNFNAKLKEKIKGDYTRKKFFLTEFEVIEGDWEVDGDLMIQRNQSLLVKGNLKVNGILFFTSSPNKTLSNNPFIIIEGDVAAQNVLMDGGFEYLQIGGDFKVEKMTACSYSKGNAAFDIGGLAQTDVLLHRHKSALSFQSYFKYNKEVFPHSKAILEASIFTKDNYDSMNIAHKVIFDFLKSGQKILSDNIEEAQVDLDEYYQLQFEKYFKDWGYAYYDWAGCEILHLSDSDIREGYIHPESGDWIVHDVRGKSGTYGVSHDDYSMGVVKIKNAKKHGINYREKKLPLLVDTYNLLERYQWVVNLFISWAHRKSVNPYSCWENVEALDADFEKEKKAFVEDPYLALYWLLHFGLTVDDRYEEVKKIVLENKLEEQLKGFKMCLGFFNKTNAFYDLKISGGYSSRDDFTNVFLIRRAYLVWVSHSYNYKGGENALEKWWLSIEIYPKVDESLIQRIRWLRNNLNKFEKWNDFDQLMADKDKESYPLLSYIMASHPSVKDKSKYADLFVQEIMEHKEVWKYNTQRLFAQTMMWDLRDYFEDKKALKKAMAFYFSDETASEKYEDLLKTYQEDNKDFEAIRNKVKELHEVFSKLKSIKSADETAAILENIDQQLASLEPEDLFMVIENIKDNGLAKRAFRFLYINEIPEKEIHLTRLFVRLGLNSDEIPEIFSERFPELIKNEFDPNLRIVLSWLDLPTKDFLNDSHSESSRESASMFLLNVVHFKSVFNSLISLLNSNSNKEVSSVIFSSLFKTNFKLKLNPLDKLNKKQLETMIEKALWYVDKFATEYLQPSCDAIRTIYYCDNLLAKDYILKWQKDAKLKAHFKNKKIGLDSLLEEILGAFESALEFMEEKENEMSQATYLLFQDEKSHKFWEIKVSGTSFEVRYGKVGGDGKKMTKEFTSAIKAKEAADRLVEQKLKKGYKR